MKLFKLWPLMAIFLLSVAFFWPFFFKGLMPVPADTIVGMYHPWRDKVWDSLTSGVPFKNFLITDPVRQQIPWRKLVINVWQSGQQPAWNPYNLAGSPLAANFQSAPFYIFNLLFFVFDFNTAWGVLIWLQPLLAGIFLYLFLRAKKLSQVSSFLGAVSFSFGGFFIAWLEWGTVLHAALWLPLILLAIEKNWKIIFVFALVQSFFAGHLQVFFYVFLFSLLYLWRQKNFLSFWFAYLLVLIMTLPQWRPTWQLIQLSGRTLDQADWTKPGWFVAFKHLAQFLAPDFFGSPTTLNYWGEWNYGELVGFVGVIPLFLALWAIIKKRGLFFVIFGLAVLSLALPTPWAKLIYQWQIPFLATSQPTRLLFLVGFCLAVLAAYGLDEFLKRFSWKIIWPIIFYLGLWLVVLLGKNPDLAISQRNLILPSGIALVFVGLVLAKKIKFSSSITYHLSLLALIGLTIFDLFRFGWKFNPFVKQEWLFPQTQAIDFLQKDKSVFRIMSVDSRLMAPNFSSWYGLQDVAGYEPLFLQRYAELIAAMERDEPNIQPPFGFNRMITPQNWGSPLVNLLNVKYILALNDLTSPNLDLVFQEGETRVYENKEALPRAFLVTDFQAVNSKQEAIEFLMNKDIDLANTVVLEEVPNVGAGFMPARVAPGVVEILDYQPNQIRLAVETSQPAILVLTDAYYPGWQATIDGEAVKIYRADYHFRAIIVPEGKHEIMFKYEG